MPLMFCTNLEVLVTQVGKARNNVPAIVPKLAGVEPYEAGEVQTSKPLIGMSADELKAIAAASSA